MRHLRGHLVFGLLVFAVAAAAPAIAQAQSITVSSSTTTSFSNNTPLTIVMSEIPTANSVQLLMACASGPCLTSPAQNITLTLGRNLNTYSVVLNGGNLAASTATIGVMTGVSIVNAVTSSPSTIGYLPDGTWNLTARYTRTSTLAVISTTSAFQQTYWRVTPAPIITAPTSSQTITKPLRVSFTLPANPLGTHDILSGTLSLTFTGSAAPIGLQLTDGTVDSNGLASFTLDPSAPQLSANVTAVTNGPTIPDDTYAVTVSYQDARSHAAASGTSTNVVLRTVTPPPVLISPTTGSTVTFPPVVSYSFPVAAATASVTFTPTGGGTALTFPIPTTNPSDSFIVPRTAAGLIGNFTVTLAYLDVLGNPAASVQATNVTIQSDCAAGSYFNGRCVACTTCAANAYQVAACTATNDTVCAACGAIANCSSTTCSGSSDQLCAVCAPGYFASGGACAPCSVGCPAGTYESMACSGTGDRVCASCAAIDHCASATCSSGAGTTCTACASGFFLSGNACVACSTSCPAGQYQTAACSAGADRTCAACGAVAHCAAAACSGGSDQHCLTCAAGFYLANGMCVACSGACPAGQFMTASCSAAADRICAACDASCASCSGTPTHCTSCATGAYLDQNSCQGCRTCGPGSHQVTACGTAANTVCADCSAGTFADTSNAPACQRCAAGTFAPNAGAAECPSCAAGTFSADGQNVCSACAAGQVAPSSMSPGCLACGPGTYPAADGTACLSCPAGTASNADHTACTACMPGTFAADPGATACAPCDVGTFATSPGATSCEACPAGTFAGATGSVRCAACVPGVPSVGGAACAPRDAGAGADAGQGMTGAVGGEAGASGAGGVGGEPQPGAGGAAGLGGVGGASTAGVGGAGGTASPTPDGGANTVTSTGGGCGCGLAPAGPGRDAAGLSVGLATLAICLARWRARRATAGSDTKASPR